MRIAAFGQKAGLCRKREHLYLFHNDQLYTSGDRVIEDSGGEASAATGQGMAESAVGTQGILEVTDSENTT